MIPGSLSVGRDGAVVVVVNPHVQRRRPLVPLVKGNAHPNNVHGVVKVIFDPAPVVVIAEDVSLAGPAVVGVAAVVPSVCRYAAVRGAAVRAGLVIVSSPFDSDGCPEARVNEGWSTWMGGAFNVYPRVSDDNILRSTLSCEFTPSSSGYFARLHVEESTRLVESHRLLRALPHLPRV